MVMMFVGGVVSIPPVENLWGGSVLFPPESIVVNLLKLSLDTHSKFNPIL
jgi:hypothetical protein